MVSNVLIEASAGTGKTQALAMRLIALLKEGVKAHEIVALTFSRAAAGEIFERFVTLLAAEAQTSPNMTRCLRETIACQHLCSVGTLDSFLLRIVRSFPLELGLTGSLELLSDYDATAARRRISSSVLRRSDPETTPQFVQAFLAATDFEAVRSPVAEYEAIIKNWLELYLSNLTHPAWTQEKKTLGIYQILSAYEALYDREIRRKGQIVFSDVPRLMTRLDAATRQALEYRLDLKLKAWALDEFQDTSREQWKALEGLIDAAKQSDGEKSVFLVGDTKQAIYGWRNGDVSIFRAEQASGAYQIEQLTKSYRFGSAITRAVNQVFRSGRIQDEVPTWQSPEHESARPHPEGFVQTVELSFEGRFKQQHFIAPIVNALKAVNPVARGIATAILVRTNTFGEFLAKELTKEGVSGVVWEGESHILDTPALLAFLDLLILADHPGDPQAYRHFLSTWLCALKYPTGAPSAAQISAEFAQAFASRGLVRTFRELRALLPAEATNAWSDFTEERFTDFLRAAAEFELSLKPGVRLSDFAEFLKTKQKRNLAEPGKIKIMTIHRSKGLGFDYILLPLYEPRGLATSRDEVLFFESEEERQVRLLQEALCGYYVAMTRAKRAMTIFLHPSPKKSSKKPTLRFSDIVRDAYVGEIGNPTWYEDYQRGEKPLSAAVALPPLVRSPRKHWARKLPSVFSAEQISAGDLFAQTDTARGEARAIGSEIHAQYEAIDYLEVSVAQTDLEKALVKRGDEIELWREKSYELINNGAWVSGCIDRVVFYRDGTVMISDYKTNARHAHESVTAFQARLTTTYASQMKAYRDAVHLLTGIPTEKIQTQLLATATQSVFLV